MHATNFSNTSGNESGFKKNGASIFLFQFDLIQTLGGIKTRPVTSLGEHFERDAKYGLFLGIDV